MDIKQIVLGLTKEQIEELKKQLEVTEDILVPDCIKIEKHCGCGDNLGIKFNESRQVLFYDDYFGGMYGVSRAGRFGDKLFNTVKCKLIPCKREDLKPGDTAYTTNDENDKFADLENYCKILDDLKEVYIFDDHDVSVCSNDTDYWYKVVPVE